jgi:hypothetical protein
MGRDTSQAGIAAVSPPPSLAHTTPPIHARGSSAATPGNLCHPGLVADVAPPGDGLRQLDEPWPETCYDAEPQWSA